MSRLGFRIEYRGENVRRRVRNERKNTSIMWTSRDENSKSTEPQQNANQKKRSNNQIISPPSTPPYTHPIQPKLTRSTDKERIQPILPNQPPKMQIRKALTGCASEMTEKSGFDVIQRERGFEERILFEVDHSVGLQRRWQDRGSWQCN